MTCPNCGAGLDDCSRFCNLCGQAVASHAPAYSQDTPPPGYECQPPQPPSQGIGSALGDKKYLVSSLCCFGWAVIFGMPRCFSLLSALFGARFDWNLFSAGFSVALHFALPLVLGLVLLGLHRRDSDNAEC